MPQRRITFDGKSYLIPEDANDTEIADLLSSIPKAPPDAPARPWSEGPGAFRGLMSQTVVPVWDAVTGAISDPVGTVKGMATAASGLPAAFQAELKRNPGMPYEAVLAGMVAKGMTKPTIDDVTRRVKAEDYTGAVGSAVGGLATLLPPGRAAQAGRVLGKPLRAAGRGVAGAVIDAVPAVAQQALDEGTLWRGVGAGGRKVEAASQEAAKRATASAPGNAGQGTGGVKFVAKQPKPRRPLLDPEGPNPIPESPGFAAQAERAERATAEPGKAYTPAQTIKKSEDYRQSSLAKARETTRGDAGVREDANKAAWHRGNVSQVLPAEGKAALNRVEELQPLAEALAHTQGRQALTGKTPFIGPPLKLVHELLSTGGGTIASGIHGAGNLTSSAMQNMQRAALLARLMGQ